MNNLKCEECGSIEWVKLVNDPFQEEVYNTFQEVALCENCFIEIVNEI